jgi:hypothetical protein
MIRRLEMAIAINIHRSFHRAVSAWGCIPILSARPLVGGVRPVGNCCFSERAGVCGASVNLSRPLGLSVAYVARNRGAFGLLYCPHAWVPS